VAAKFKVDLEALKKQLSKEIAVTQILENLGLPKEAKPYVFNGISRLQKEGTNVVKVKPGVYKIGANGKKVEKTVAKKVVKKVEEKPKTEEKAKTEEKPKEKTEEVK
jgi:hypothetical protein